MSAALPSAPTRSTTPGRASLPRPVSPPPGRAVGGSRPLPPLPRRGRAPPQHRVGRAVGRSPSRTAPHNAELGCGSGCRPLSLAPPPAPPRRVGLPSLAPRPRAGKWGAVGRSPVWGSLPLPPLPRRGRAVGRSPSRTAHHHAGLGSVGCGSGCRPLSVAHSALELTLLLLLQTKLHSLGISILARTQETGNL